MVSASLVCALHGGGDWSEGYVRLLGGGRFLKVRQSVVLRPSYVFFLKGTVACDGEPLFLVLKFRASIVV
jgi:hypothetical protein